MTRQTWTAFVSALLFVAMAALLAVVPVPFVTWSPGRAQDTLGSIRQQPVITVDGIETYPTTGRLDLTTVEVTRTTARLTLPEAVLAYWLPHRDALPRDAVYDPGKSSAQVETEEADMMSTAQDDAVVAALRAARQPVTELPVISSVTVSGPAHDKLRPGDLVLSVDGVPTATPAAVGELVRKHRAKQTVTFVVLRDRVRTTVRVATVESSTQPGVAMVGVGVDTGYRYTPRISFDLGREIGGPSAGLVFALAIYDKITSGALLDGRHIAGTGTITPTGEVGLIGGIEEKVAAAERGGATVFLVPAANCPNLAGVRTGLRLVKVATLAESVTALQTLATPGGSDRLAGC